MIKEIWRKISTRNCSIVSEEEKEFASFSDAMLAYQKESDKLFESGDYYRLETETLDMVDEEEINAFFDSLC